MILSSNQPYLFLSTDYFSIIHNYFQNNILFTWIFHKNNYKFTCHSRQNLFPNFILILIVLQSQNTFKSVSSIPPCKQHFYKCSVNQKTRIRETHCDNILYCPLLAIIYQVSYIFVIVFEILFVPNRDIDPIYSSRFERSSYSAPVAIHV